MHSKLIELTDRYHDRRQKKLALFSHLVGVPLLTLAVLILFGWVKVGIPGILGHSV